MKKVFKFNVKYKENDVSLMLYVVLVTIFFLIVSKLQSDLKTTKIDEMRVQLEVLYSELVRLQMMKDSTGSAEKSRYFLDKLLLLA